MPEQARAQDAAGNLYDVSADHSRARRDGTGEWKPMGQLRFEVGPLHLLPRKEGDDA